MADISGLLLYLVLIALFLYALYFVVKAAVRDGIREARRRDQ
ncbi:DUF6019 family protein [Saccharomonospora piscinae]|nr:DUF6019 family protein [Saccharomonospora piscinae]